MHVYEKGYNKELSIKKATIDYVKVGKESWLNILKIMQIFRPIISALKSRLNVFGIYKNQDDLIILYVL